MKEYLGEFSVVVGIIALSLLVCLCIVVAGLWLVFSLDTSNPLPPPEEAASPAWSPDGQRIAFECYLEGPTTSVRDSDQRQFRSDTADICVVNVDGSNRVRLTANEVADNDPTWSPDGTRIAYIGGDSIYVMNSDGSNQQRLVVHPLPESGIYYWNRPEWIAWSPDGKYLTFSACLEGQDRDIYILDVDSGTWTNLTAGNGTQDTHPGWMPDSKQIVFLSSHLPGDESCDPSPHLSTTSRLKIINIDGTNEEDIYGEAFYITVSTSLTGRVAFVANMKATSDLDEYQLAEDTHLYAIRPSDEEAVILDDDMRAPSWSPDGRYLTDSFNLLNVETGEKRKLPQEFPFGIPIAWSPDGRKLATTGDRRIGNIYAQTIVILDLDTYLVHTLVPSEE